MPNLFRVSILYVKNKVPTSEPVDWEFNFAAKYFELDNPGFWLMNRTRLKAQANLKRFDLLFVQLAPWMSFWKQEIANEINEPLDRIMTTGYV